MTDVSDIFVSNLSGIAKASLPEEVVLQARLCIADYIACACAGSSFIRPRIDSFLEASSLQSGSSAVLGTAFRTSLHNAALLNAMSAHSTELDDGHRLGMLHLGAGILSALLPVAELEGLPFDRVISGTVAGYEAAVRLAISMQPSHKMRGYHTSGTCGTVGGAVAIAVAMDFPERMLKSAISAAVAGAGGLLELQENSSQMKPYNLAHAAVAAISAAYTAKAGFIGPDDPIGGRRGILAVMSENADTSALTYFNPGDYSIMGIYRKPYAACRHCHPAIEASLKIKDDHHLQPSDIEEVNVKTYKLAVGGHDHKEIKGIASAKLSIPFSVALAMVKGSAGMGDFNEKNICDPEILDLTSKVSITQDDTLTSWSPRKRAAIVSISTKSGETYSCEIDYPKGEPENPMTYEEIVSKFRGLTLGIPLNEYYRQYGL